MVGIALWGPEARKLWYQFNRWKSQTWWNQGALPMAISPIMWELGPTRIQKKNYQKILRSPRNENRTADIAWKGGLYVRVWLARTFNPSRWNDKEKAFMKRWHTRYRQGQGTKHRMVMSLGISNRVKPLPLLRLIKQEEEEAVFQTKAGAGSTINTKNTEHRGCLWRTTSGLSHF